MERNAAAPLGGSESNTTLISRQWCSAFDLSSVERLLLSGIGRCFDVSNALLGSSTSLSCGPAPAGSGVSALNLSCVLAWFSGISSRVAPTTCAPTGGGSSRGRAGRCGSTCTVLLTRSEISSRRGVSCALFSQYTECILSRVLVAYTRTLYMLVYPLSVLYLALGLPIAVQVL